MQKLSRLAIDELRDPMFTNALRVWDGCKGSMNAGAATAALLPLCDATTNLYHTDMTSENFWGYRISMVNSAFDLQHQRSFEFGDYPDRNYFDRSVRPGYCDLQRERAPVFYKIQSEIQGKFAVYERLLLPVIENKATLSCVSVSRLMMIIDQPFSAATGKLSPRERECLALLAAGNSAKRIAVALELEQTTVENYLARLKKKLAVRSTAHAAAVGAMSLRQYQTAPASPPQAGAPILTPRERQCLGFLASGLTVQCMADELQLSAKTIEKHIVALRKKLGARNAAAAVTLGIGRIVQ